MQDLWGIDKKISSVALKAIAITIVMAFLLLPEARATGPIYLTASWYSIHSLKDEGTWEITYGIMANGKEFRDEDFTCATRMFSIGTRLRITNLENKRHVEVRVTDKIGKRFATSRIDLSKAAFYFLSEGDLDKGLLKVKVERIK